MLPQLRVIRNRHRQLLGTDLALFTGYTVIDKNMLVQIVTCNAGPKQMYIGFLKHHLN